jgi:ribosome-binding protein aMBF1 (putative translation factor)
MDFETHIKIHHAKQFMTIEVNSVEARQQIGFPCSNLAPEIDKNSSVISHVDNYASIKEVSVV